MSNSLQFSQFAIKERKYYAADFMLKKNEYNLPHSHDFYEVIITIQGEFIEYNNGTDCLLSKKCAHFIRPNDEHYLVSTNHQISILRNIAFDHDFFDTILKKLEAQNTDRLFEPFTLDESTFQNYIKKTELLLQSTYSEEVNLCLVKSIISDLIIMKLCSSDDDHNIPKWLRVVYSQFQEETNFIKGLPRLVQLSGKSQAHLTRELKNYYGVSSTELVNNLRIQKAATLLRLSDDYILDISLECGFQNLSYFNRVFKEKYGISPRQYRDNNKKFFRISR